MQPTIYRRSAVHTTQRSEQRCTDRGRPAPRGRSRRELCPPVLRGPLCCSGPRVRPLFTRQAALFPRLRCRSDFLSPAAPVGPAMSMRRACRAASPTWATRASSTGPSRRSSRASRCGLPLPATGTASGRDGACATCPCPRPLHSCPPARPLTTPLQLHLTPPVPVCERDRHRRPAARPAARTGELDEDHGPAQERGCGAVARRRPRRQGDGVRTARARPLLARALSVRRPPRPIPAPPALPPSTTTPPLPCAGLSAGTARPTRRSSCRPCSTAYTSTTSGRSRTRRSTYADHPLSTLPTLAHGAGPTG